MASSSYSRRNSSRGSPTRPEKNGARCERAGGIAAGPVGGLAAMWIGGGGATGGTGGGAGTVVTSGCEDVWIGVEGGVDAVVTSGCKGV